MEASHIEGDRDSLCQGGFPLHQLPERPLHFRMLMRWAERRANSKQRLQRLR